MARIRAAAPESEGGASMRSERASTASQGCTTAAYRYYTLEVPVKSIRAWLGLDRPETAEPVPLRDVLDALDHLEPARARYLAAFAYLLGRIAHADHHVSPQEIRAIENALIDHGQLTEEKAVVVTQLVKANQLFLGRQCN